MHLNDSLSDIDKFNYLRSLLEKSAYDAIDVLLNLTAVTLENVRSLKALGVEQPFYGAMLTSVLLNKLPSNVRLIESRRTPSD